MPPDGSAHLIIRCKVCNGFLDRVLRHSGESEHQAHCRHCNHDNIYTLVGMTVTEHKVVRVVSQAPAAGRRSQVWTQ